MVLSFYRRPAVEYIRDVYAELMAMGAGVRRPGDRSDISSDEEDEMEVKQKGSSVNMSCPHMIHAPVILGNPAKSLHPYRLSLRALGASRGFTTFVVQLL